MTVLNFNWFRRIFSWEEQPPESHRAYRPLEYPSIYGAAIWSVGGGKGGVGKSLIASNLGICLSRLGRRVLLVDADLGAANLHTFLGVEGGRAALSSFLKEEIEDISAVIVKTPVPNLDLISGTRDSLDVADVNGNKIARLKNALKRIDYDNVIIDIGPGTAANLLDLFLMANEGIILATPEPTTIENNYRFLKCLYLRKIKTVAEVQEDGRLRDLLQRIFSDSWSQRVKTVSDILDQISRLDPGQGRFLRDYIAGAGISMIINQTRKSGDMDVGPAIRRACSEYFGIDMGYLGAVGYEDNVVESIRSRKPLALHYADSPAAKSIERCLDELMKRQKNPNVGGQITM